MKIWIPIMVNLLFWVPFTVFDIVFYFKARWGKQRPKPKWWWVPGSGYVLYFRKG